MKVQILDYSLDRGATPLFLNHMDASVDVVKHHITVVGSLDGIFDQQGITHVIHSGSALSINENFTFTEPVVNYIHQLASSGVRQYGICYGHQLLCRALVGDHAVRSSPRGLEAGWNAVTFNHGDDAIAGLGGDLQMWQHHFDEVTEVPQGSTVFATAGHTHIQGWVNPSLSAMGTQFHPEFDHVSGNDYFRNDAATLQAHGLDLDEMIAQTPDTLHGRALFDYFLGEL